MENKNDMELVESVDRLVKFLRVDKIYFDEFASNVIIRLVGEPETTVKASLSRLSPDEQHRLADFARAYFDKNEFLPHPTVFLVDTRDPCEVENKRQELKPKYEQLLKHIDDCARKSERR